MRILINGIMTGGNCPPFIHNLRSYPVDFKIVDSGLIQNTIPNKSDLINDSDLIIPQFLKPELWLFKLLKLLRFRSILYSLLGIKYKKVIQEYNPDIILHHGLYYRNLSLQLNHSIPQVAYVYGSEVAGDRIRNKYLKKVIQNTDFVIVSTLQMQKKLSNFFEQHPDKFLVMPWGLYGLPMIEKTLNLDRSSIRDEFGYSKDDILIVDNRSLRSFNTGVFQILSVVKEVYKINSNVRFLLLKGQTGEDDVISQVKQQISSDEDLNAAVILYNDTLPEPELFKLLYASDIYISLLPNDHFGAGVIEAALLKNKLLLTDLQVYHDHLGEYPVYVKDFVQKEMMKDFLSVIDRRENMNPEVYTKLKRYIDPEERSETLLKFLSSFRRKTGRMNDISTPNN